MEEILTIQCDICGTQLSMNEYSQGKASIKDLEITYFQCPTCGYRYPYLIEDREQRKLHLQIQSIWAEAEIRREKGKELSPSKIRLLNRLFERAKAHQATLRDTFLTAVTDQLNQSDHTETNSLTGEEEL